MFLCLILAPLTALPLARIQFDLPAQEFKNGLALQYKKPLTWLLQYCNSCDSDFSIEHALSCRFGELVVCRYNEVWYAIVDLASLVWNNVIHEPVVCERSATSDGTLVADLCVQGVWIPHYEALFSTFMW